MFTDTITFSVPTPRIGWSRQRELVDDGTRYVDQPRVGSSDLETATSTCPVVKSPTVTNHRPDRVSYWIRGSPTSSDPVAKKSGRWYVATDTPCFEYTPKSMF